MKGSITYLFFIWILFTLSSCTTMTAQKDGEELFSEDELDFLSEEEEFFEDELKKDEPSKTRVAKNTSDDNDFTDEEEEFFEEETSDEGAPLSVADKEEQEAQAAENELKEIEDEFAEFIEEDEPSEVAEATESESLDLEGSEAEVVVASEEDNEFLEETPTVAEDTTEETVTTEVAAEETVTTEVAANDGPIQVKNIRYEDQQIFIDTLGGSPSYRSRFNEATKQFIIELPNAVIMDKLKWPYIMKDFQSGFALLQADQKEPQVVRVIVQMRSQQKAPLLMEREGGLIVSASTVDLTSDQSTLVANEETTPFTEEESYETEPPSLEVDNNYEDLDRLEGEPKQVLHAQTIEEFVLGDHKFYGHPITLDVRDTSLKDILHFLVEDSGINMIISDSIPNTNINIRLQAVPWDQALVLIMKKNKLGYIREGSVVTISSLNEIKDHQKQLQELIIARENLIPLQLEIIPLAYAKASNMSQRINLFKTPRGKIIIDNSNNSLIIQDTSYALDNMKKLIQKLDRTPKQVMISAKIVEATESFTRNFGVSWGISGETFNPLVAIGALSQIEVTPAPLLRALPGAPDQGTLGTNLTIGNLGPGLGDLDVALGFAESDGQAKVISSPRIMAINGQSASVSQTTESIAFSAVTTESGTQTAIQRSPINLTLSVLPEITNVNSIYMRVSMNRGSEGSPISDSQGSTARPTSSRTASTNILVKNGHTAVIGGIYETRNAGSLQGIPFLKDIPVLSWLFSQVRDETSRTELLLFLTPRIIDINQEKVNVASEGIR